MTLVKICGLTRSQDVDTAVALGAWAIGFVITESPRRTAPSLVAKLAARVPPEVLSVAVFTIEKPFEIAKIVGRTGVRAVQLSAGTFGPNVAAVRAALSTAGLPRVALIVARDTRGAEKADFVLLELHDEHDVEVAQMLGAPLVGINNRDLGTLRVDLATTERLAALLRPAGDERVIVAESGIASRDDALRMRSAGASAVLVGEALVRDADAATLGERVGALRGDEGGGSR